MKKLLIVALTTVCSISFATLHTWDFSSGADAAVSDTGVRLSGSVDSNVEGKWNNAITQGDLNSSSTSGAGTVNLAQNGGSDYMGPIQGFGRATDQLTLTISLDNIYMSGNPSSHTDFTIALTDSENTTTVGQNDNRHWIGISTYDLFGNNRLVNAVKSYDADLTIDTSDAGVPSFGHAGDSSQNGRKSFNLLTANGDLEWNTADNEVSGNPLVLGLTLDIGLGTWNTTVNGVAQGNGTFDNAVGGITGIDGIQTRMANFESGDYVEISNMTLEVIPEPATIGLLGLAASGLVVFRKRFKG